MANFSVTFSAQTISGAQDIFEIMTPSDRLITISEVRFGQYSEAGEAQSELLGVQIISGYGTSGDGTVVTPVNLTQHAIVRSSTSTCKTNSSTLASGGDPLVLVSDAWNIQAPYIFTSSRDSGRIEIGVSRRVVIRLTAPLDSILANGSLVFEETPT